MPLTTSGAIFLAKAATGLNSPQLFTSNAAGSASGAHLAVGNGTTAFNIGDTDLVGSQKLRKPATVTESSGVLTANSTFGTGEAVFDWAEWAFANQSSGGQILGRKLDALGLKPTTQVWAMQALLTFAAA
jgi:hypothetical protein